MVISLFARHKWRDQGPQALRLGALARHLMRDIGLGAGPDRPRLPLDLLP